MRSAARPKASRGRTTGRSSSPTSASTTASRSIANIATLLERTARQYGVPAEYIVAIIGVETNYGRNTGKYKVLDALVTLGLYYPPRANFFREQLKTLLELPDSQLGGPIDTLTGSYAGAQGWGQFMPSSIRDFARGRRRRRAYRPEEFAGGHLCQRGQLLRQARLGRPAARWPGRAQPDAAARPITVKDSSPQWPLEQLRSLGLRTLAAARSLAHPASLQSLEGAERPGVLVHLPEFLRDHASTTAVRCTRWRCMQLAQAIAAGVRMADARQ